MKYWRVWLALVVMVLAGAAAIQGSAASGPSVVTRTQGALNFWVDDNLLPDGGMVGNDSRACTSNDAGACATLQGVIGKLTGMQICDTVTINLAGNIDGGYLVYSGNTSIVGLDWCSRDGGASGGSIKIAGPPASQWATYYVDAGSNTGTATSITAASAGNAYTVNDTGQSWVDGGLKGYFLMPTSGTGNNNPVPIIDNTTNSVRLTGSASMSTNDTYRIAVPSVWLQSPSSSASLSIGLNRQQNIAIQDIAFFGSQGWPSMGNPGGTGSLTRTWFFNNQAAAPGFSLGDHHSFQFNRVAFESARSNVLSTSGYIDALFMSNVYAHGPNAGTWTVNYGHNGQGQCLSLVAETTGSNGTPILFSTTSQYSLSCTGTARVICASGTAGSTGIYAGGPTGNVTPTGNINLSPTAITSEGCGTAVLVTGANSLLHAFGNASTWLVIGATNGYNTARGGRTYLTAGNTFTFTGTTNELVIDGSNKSYAGNLTGNGCISNTTYLSAVCE